MKMLRFLLAGALLFTMLPAGAQETMDELTLRQHMLQAEGKPPASYITEIRTTSTEGEFVGHDFVRGLDYRYAYEYGPFHDEYGRLEGREWDHNANGLTTIHEPPLGRGKPDPEKVTVTRVHDPFDAWRYARLNLRGWGTVRYVDPQTYRVLRVETLTAWGRIETDYDDFRMLGGYTQSYHWKTNNEVNEVTSDSRITSLESRAVTDADLAIPPNEPFVIFPNNEASVDIPATFRFPKIVYPNTTISPHIVVRAFAGGRGLDFILDSGSSGIVIDGKVARELGLRIYAQHAAAVAGRFDTGVARIPEMRVGDLIMRNVAVGTIPIGWNTEQDTKAVGLLGYDFIRSVGLMIDYMNRRVTAVKAESFAPPLMTPESDILPIRLGSHVPIIAATINGATAEGMIVDTGGAGDLMLFDYFNRRYPEALAPRVAARIGLETMPFLLTGVGGVIDAKGLVLQQVDIGRYHFRDYEAMDVVSMRNYTLYAVDGLIGPGILRHFTVVFDYAGGKMYLVHNEGQ